MQRAEAGERDPDVQLHASAVRRRGARGAGRALAAAGRSTTRGSAAATSATASTRMRCSRASRSRTRSAKRRPGPRRRTPHRRRAAAPGRRMRSAIYTGTVQHERLRPRRHRLTYRVFSLLIDLDELPTLARCRLFMGFRESDHGDGKTPLRQWATGAAARCRHCLRRRADQAALLSAALRLRVQSAERLLLPPTHPASSPASSTRSTTRTASGTPM